MYLPGRNDYIDIHTHGAVSSPGIFSVENLMAHENLQPVNNQGLAYTAGIHPWYLTESNQKQLVDYIIAISSSKDLIAIGEAGFDKLRGPSAYLQKEIFGQQVNIAREKNKPVVIHCVKAWDDLLAAHKNLRPEMPWLVHGFRGKKELARQLLDRGMFISLWFEFSLRPESAILLRYLPLSRIFLETDGADVSIKDIYEKVAGDLELKVEELKETIYSNFREFFKIQESHIVQG